MPSRPELAALAANLACRRRLGLALVQGSPRELEDLLAALAPRREAASPAQENPAAAPAAPAAEELEQIQRQMGNCTRCALHEKRHRIVFGEGPAPARIMFIGEGPGAEEDRQGRPFVGPAGRLLDLMLAAVGLRRQEVYITNIVKCRPPGNREPRPEEAAACRRFLEAQVQAVDPEIICTLGRPATQSLLETKAPISTLRGNWHRFMERPLLPTFHPAYLLRTPERKREAYQDLKTLVRALKEGAP